MSAGRRGAGSLRAGLPERQRQSGGRRKALRERARAPRCCSPFFQMAPQNPRGKSNGESRQKPPGLYLPAFAKRRERLGGFSGRGAAGGIPARERLLSRAEAAAQSQGSLPPAAPPLPKPNKTLLQGLLGCFFFSV